MHQIRKRKHERKTTFFFQNAGPVAQLAEQLPLKESVERSTRSRLTYETRIRRSYKKSVRLPDQYGAPPQSAEMVYVVLRFSQYAGELEDITTGIRDSKRHPHHKHEDLLQAKILARRTIGQICRKIYSNNQDNLSRNA